MAKFVNIAQKEWEST